MNIENHMYNAKTMLKTAQDKIEARDYTSALVLLCNAYSHVRGLIELVYKLDREASAATRSAGEDCG